MYIPGILAELPDRLNLKKIVSRERLRNLPANPTNIEDLGEVPARYRQTLGKDQFLIYDSNDEDEDVAFGRVLIFSTNENLRDLARSPIWFLDGTFSTVPAIFFQLFAIIAATTQRTRQGDQTVGLPMVYALMQSKEEAAYRKIFDKVADGIRAVVGFVNLPLKMMSDFELAIIHAARAFANNNNNVSCCFFHLCQSVYRHVQTSGLQNAYCDPENREIKKKCTCYAP